MNGNDKLKSADKISVTEKETRADAEYNESLSMCTEHIAERKHDSIVETYGVMD